MLDCSFGFFYCLLISIHVYDMQMRILDCGLFLACLTGWLNFLSTVINDGYKQLNNIFEVLITGETVYYSAIFLYSR